MSWYANTVLPTIEDVFADVEPPNSPADCALIIGMAGYDDVAKYIAALNDNNYENVLWDAKVREINMERPQAFADSEDETYEERYNNK